MNGSPSNDTRLGRSLGTLLADVLEAARDVDAKTEVALARDRAFEAIFQTSGPRTYGRYVILERVGAGAMGVVHAAYDSELDRKVALKLLRGGGGEGGARAGQRLIREAQALAKLSHPNVVAVHDAGTLDGMFEDDDEPQDPSIVTPAVTPVSAQDHELGSAGIVFIAMEFVEGETLRGWLEATPRSPDDVLRVLVQAGRGLVAAHAAGLVHRDFEPDNVMVGRDGRARVMDFGLVRPLRGPSEHTREDSCVRPDLDTLAMPMTRAGTAVGTPTYMAPEQMRGEAANERSDQFAFCVSAWEALFGVRPYAGGTLLELAANVVSGRRSRPPAARVPRWLRRVLERGLDPDPRRARAVRIVGCGLRALGAGAPRAPAARLSSHPYRRSTRGPDRLPGASGRHLRPDHR